MRHCDEFMRSARCARALVGPACSVDARTECVRHVFETDKRTHGVRAPQQRALHARARAGIVTLAVALLLLLPVVAAVAQPPDPFYLRLLREGSDAYNRHEYGTAVRQLRIACFGLLGEPDVLADGLTRLALAEAAAGDTGEFRHTFQRIVEVEDRFHAYTKAALTPEMRAAFERLVVSSVPAATLEATPAFARLVPTPDERLAKEPPAERRKDLLRLARRDPKQAKWPQMLAELELAEGSARKARDYADDALAIDAGDRAALRVRGLAWAADEKWEEAAADLEKCGAARTDAAAAQALLRSLVELKRWPEAAELYAGLPSELLKNSRVRELGDRVETALRERRAAAATPTPESGDAVVPSTPAPPPVPRPTAPILPTPVPTIVPTIVPTVLPTAAPAPTPTPGPTGSDRRSGLPASARAELERAEQLADRNRVAQAFALAREVADAYPSSGEAQRLAGELAYRESRWAEAVAYFNRGGEVPDSEPIRQFCLAVSLYETGDRTGAATVLKRCLPHILRTDYVKQYEKKILGRANSRP